MPLPGSTGEHQAQEQFDTTHRALTFYHKQMLHALNPLTREFILRQEMVFIATADAHGAGESLLGVRLEWSKYSNSPSHRRLRLSHRLHFGLSAASVSSILSVKRDGKA